MEKKYDPERVSAESQKALVARMLDEMNKSPTGDHPNSGWHEMRKVLEEARIPPPMKLTERNDNIAAVVLDYFKEVKASAGKDAHVNFWRWNDEHIRLLNEYCAAKVDPTEIPEPPLTVRARNDRIAQIMVAYYRSERVNRPTAEKVSFVRLQQYEREQLNRLCSTAVEKEEFMGIPQQPETVRDVLKAVYDSGVLRGQPKDIQTRVEVALGLPYVVREAARYASVEQEAKEAQSNRRKNNISILITNAHESEVEAIAEFNLMPYWLKSVCKEELARREELKK